jgi:flagellar M-ring protein FliF
VAQPFNIGDFWQRASLLQRVVLLGVVLGCIGGAAVLVNWARQPSLALLYAGLGPEEAAGMVEKIRESGTSYELKQGGTAVYVPEDQVASLRLTLAAAGMPAGQNPGYTLIEQDSFGLSPFTERVRYNRAVEGEVARSVQTLDSVASARVHIVRPEAALLRSGERKASATVVLKLRGGYRLASSNVAAIVHLVAGAVEGLSPDGVVVVDDHGSLLTPEGEDGLNTRMASVLEQKRQVEEYLGKKAADHLAVVLGPGRATVQVAVEMVTTTLESERTIYGDGTKAVPSKETIKSTKTTDSGTAADAAPGISTDTTEETDYKVPQTTERKVVLPGEITSKTVSVIVDLTPTPTEGSDANATKLMDLKAVEEAVSNALGLKIDANDKLTVTEASFHRPIDAAGAADEGGMFNADFILEIARRASLGLLVIGALLALKMFGGRKKGAAVGEGAMPALEGQSAQLAGNLLTAGGGGGSPDLLKAQITKALQDNPDEVKRLFLSWVEGEKGEV